MRQIKFRGYDSTNKRWIYGDLTQVKDSGLFFIGEDNMDCTNVHGDSVGQYTGLKDGNGVEIYEGDIIGKDLGVITIEFGEFNPHDCVLDDYIGFHTGDNYYPWRGGSIKDRLTRGYCVIGNIHDNPELLKESDNEDNFTIKEEKGGKE